MKRAAYLLDMGACVIFCEPILDPLKLLSVRLSFNWTRFLYISGRAFYDWKSQLLSIVEWQGKEQFKFKNVRTITLLLKYSTIN
jgi:hypothetical protein